MRKTVTRIFSSWIAPVYVRVYDKQLRSFSKEEALLPSKLLPNVQPPYLHDVIVTKARRQQPPGLRRGSAAVRLLGLWVRIPAWMSVSCECCVSSLRRADNSSRGVLPSVVCPQSVISKPRKGRSRPGIESKRQKNKKIIIT